MVVDFRHRFKLLSKSPSSSSHEMCCPIHDSGRRLNFDAIYRRASPYAVAVVSIENEISLENTYEHGSTLSSKTKSTSQLPSEI